MTKTKQIKAVEPKEKTKPCYTKGEILEFHDFLNRPLNIQKRRFLYVRESNRLILQELVKPLLPESRIPISEKFKEFEEKRDEINKRFSQDESGLPKIKTATDPQTKKQYSYYEFDQNNPEYRTEIKKLRDEYKDAIAERDEQVKWFNEVFVNEPFEKEVQFLTIPLKELPEDMSEATFSGITFFIEEFVKKLS